MTPESERILASILDRYDSRNIVKITEGWDSHVFVVDSRRIYKIPFSHGRNSIPKEHFLLKQLRPQLGDLIPSHPELYPYDNGQGVLPVLSYDFIPGTTLESNLPINDSEEIALAVAFFRIFRMIHLAWLPTSTLIGDGNPLFSWRERYVRMKERFTEENYPDLQGNLLDYVQNLLSEFTADMGNFRFRPAFIHGDIDPRNIIWNSTGLCVAGIIDWAEAGYGDPAFDAASLFFQESLGFKYLKISGLASDASAIRRIEFYHRLVPLYWIEYGYTNNDTALVMKGMKELMARRDFSIVR